jgi:chorismate mutase
MSERRVRALRGATTAARDDAAELCAATRELLAALVERNDLAIEDIVSALFTVTPDLTSEFPARAARELGWTDIPLLCAATVEVPGALPRCIRVLLHVETTRPRGALVHVYLRGAESLRPDLAG